MENSVIEAKRILQKYNKESFHIHHAEVVSGIMRFFAKQYDPEREEFWAVVGLLHDVDFELFPEQHCVKGVDLLQENGIDKSVIRSAMSHGYGIRPTPYEPIEIMEKILFATDELSGLIGAVAIMRPSKSLIDLELPSVKKKFKDKKFAAGCSREVIIRGAEQLGWSLDELIEKTILVMRSIQL